jgi:hypothetical protein
MSVHQVSIARDRENGGNTGNAVSTVSKAFPRQETGFSAYLSGFCPSVSAFPRFRRFRGGVS